MNAFPRRPMKHGVSTSSPISSPMGAVSRTDRRRRVHAEALAIEIGSRLRGEHVVATLDRIALQRRKPHTVRRHGSEFSGGCWTVAYHHKVRIDFSRPGKPTITATGNVQWLSADECLNVHWFETLDQPARSSRLGGAITMRVASHALGEAAPMILPANRKLTDSAKCRKRRKLALSSVRRPQHLKGHCLKL